MTSFPSIPMEKKKQGVSSKSLTLYINNCKSLPQLLPASEVKWTALLISYAYTAPLLLVKLQVVIESLVRIPFH